MRNAFDVCSPEAHIPALMWLSILIPVLLAVLVIVCILLTLVILMQRPRSEGLGAAFGSGMTENIFGAQTTTVLTKATVYLGGTFFAITLLLTILTAKQGAERRVGVLESEARKAAQAATPTHPTGGSPAPATSASAAASASPEASSSVNPATTPESRATAAPGSSATPSSAEQTPAQPAPAPSGSPKS
ncbi:MAG: preprotein translocase subunit SecG [Chthoniobacterales bacterium]